MVIRQKLKEKDEKKTMVIDQKSELDLGDSEIPQ